MPQLWLASASPRRAQLLDQVGIPFQLLAPPDINETPQADEEPQQYVLRMAQEKADAGWLSLPDSAKPDAVVLAGDTAVVKDGKILGKPCSVEHALQMLRMLSGAEHQVMSAVSLRQSDSEYCKLSTTLVRFRDLSDKEIADYIATQEGLDKAGAYAIQGFGALLVEQIKGSYSGVVGLPLEVLLPLLDKTAIPHWQMPDHN